MANNKIHLRVIVSGAETVVEANLNAPLQTVAQHALNQTEQQGRPLPEWEVRDANGAILDLTRKVETFGFDSSTVLYLQPKVGVAG
jgi:hypothetical protein